MKQFHAIVSGRVQGVCFRAETAAAAQRLGLRGFVRNLADGTVEVRAAGPAADIEQFLVYLHRGPRIARVDDVRLDWTARPPLPEGFEVRR
ncbi:MAG: acylphosphatase [Candidatus Eisenbacteria sp.]|nr:acylphosphatase [Candidatus Eisenbacteria bacterium]